MANDSTLEEARALLWYWMAGPSAGLAIQTRQFLERTEPRPAEPTEEA